MMKMLRRLLIPRLMAAGLVVAASVAAGPPPAGSTPEELLEASARVREAVALQIPDPAGRLHRPFEPAPEHKATLLFFVLHDCPKANALAPEMSRLAAFGAERGVRTLVVYAEPTLEAAAAAAHAAEYGFQMPVVLDIALHLATAVGATATPEAALVAADGAVVYRGALNDRIAPGGVLRAEAGEHYVRDAIEAVAAGKPVAVALTKAQGCHIPEPPPWNGFETLLPPPAPDDSALPLPETVTFSEHIAPVLHRRCAACHRPGEIGPFSLLTYADARRRARQIVEVTASREMPPWPAGDATPPVLWDRRLSAREIALLDRWHTAGAPEGDAAKTPEPPVFPEGWRLGPPDLELAMPVPFAVPAEGRDIYRTFVLPLGWEDDAWVRAIELRPSATAVVHHILVFVDPTGRAAAKDARTPEPGYPGADSRDLKFIAAWAPGGGVLTLPDDLASQFPKGSNLVLQTHFHPSGKPEFEATRVAVYRADGPPRHRYRIIQVPPIFSMLEGLEIPAGAKEHTVRDSFVIPIDVDAFRVGAHAHFLGRRMNLTATFPDGSRRILLDVPKWNFAWQDQYAYRERLRLPAGTRLDAEVVWDNSADNPQNPHRPPVTVRWGEQSQEEMGSLLVAVVLPDDTALETLNGALAAHIADKLVLAALNNRALDPQARRALPAAAILMRQDLNGDGVLDYDERQPFRSLLQLTGIPRMILDSSP